MAHDGFEIAMKVLIVGSGGVGKSSLIRRFCKGTFTDQYLQTIGVDFLEKKQHVAATNQDVTLMLWDTAGQEEFDAVTRTYYRGGNACVLAFSTTDRDSFNMVETWRQKVISECGESIPFVLMQNKIDLADKRVVEKEEAEALARKLKVKFFETSVKDGLNVDDIFSHLAESYVRALSGDTGKSAHADTNTSIDFSSNKTSGSVKVGGQAKEGKKKKGLFAKC